MIETLLPLALALIMFSLGLGLELRRFTEVLLRPGILLAGLVAQVIVLPLVALAVGTLLPLEPMQAAGLMILAACPGGATAGLLTRLAGGETALSITLSVLTGALAFLTVPLVVGAGLGHFLGASYSLSLPFMQITVSLVLVTLLPVSLGVWLRESRRCPPRLETFFHRLATVLFLLMVTYTFARHWGAITAALPTLGAACLLLNVLGMGSGLLIGALARADQPARLALAMECGIQNAALGMTLALSVIGEPLLAAASVTYALLMNITALAVISLRQTRLRKHTHG